MSSGMLSGGVVSGVVTAVLLVSFLIGVAWAYSARRRVEFDAAARLPLEDQETQS